MNRKAKALEFANEAYDIHITGRHISVTDAMKDYALDKISKIDRFINRIIDVDVIMDIQRYDHKVEIIMKVGNMTILSKAVTNDMYASIDKSVNKLEQQLLRYKDRVTHHHKPAPDISEQVIEPLQWEDQEEDQFEATEPSSKPAKIVKQEKRPLKVLTPHEAIVKMELSNDPFMLFMSEADRKIKLIYRREDGNYGIIEPHA